MNLLSSRSRGVCRVAAGAAVIASLALVGLAAWHIHAASSNVVFSDEWSFVPWIGSSLGGHLAWGGIWDQHNESRDVLLRGFLLASARFDHFNDQHLKYVGLGFACLTVIQVAAFSIMSVERSRRVFAAWAILPAAGMLLGLQQWEVLLEGVNCVFFSTVTFGVAAVLLFEKALRSDQRASFLIAGGIAFALLATFSTSAGLMTWIVLVVQGLLPGAKTNSRRKTTIVGLAGIGAWTVYLVGFRTDHATPLVVFEHPISSAGFFLATIGNSVLSSTGAQLQAQDLVVGAALLAVYIWCLGSYVWKRGSREQADERPFSSLILLGLLYSLVLTSSRSGFAPANASRYSTLTIIAVVGAWAVLALRAVVHAKGPLTRPGWSAVTSAGTMLLLVGVCLGFSTSTELSLTSSRAAYYQQLVEILRSPARPTYADLQLFEFSPPAAVRPGIAILRKYHLSVYATSNESVLRTGSSGTRAHVRSIDHSMQALRVNASSGRTPRPVDGRGPRRR